MIAQLAMRRVLSAVALVLLPSCRDAVAPPTVSSVRVTPGTDTLTALGASRQYAAQALDAAGRPIPDKVFAWSAADPAVVRVQGSGLVEALANGATRVRASVDGVTGEAAVAVAQQVAAVTVAPSSALLAAANDTTRFTAVARDANANVIAGSRFVWLSADHLVATVDSAGLARATANGGTTITAVADGVAGSAGVTVNQVASVLEFVVQPADHAAGHPMAQAVEVEVRDALGNRVRGIRVPVTLAPNGPTHPDLIGAATVTSVDGIAVFPNLTHHRAGTGYSLVANSPGLGTGVSESFAVTAAAIARVSVSAPAEVIVDSTFTLTVRAFDAYDNEQFGFGVNTLELSSNPWREAQVGVNGGLEGVVISRPGDGYRIRARIGAVTGESGLIGARLHFTSVSTGTYRACGLSYGRAYCWGVRLYGGPTGIIESDSMPRAAAPASLRFVQLVSGLLFTCGRTAPGAAYCWGWNPDSLPGDTARVVQGGHAFAQLAAGPEHVCGVTTAGALYCWGSNDDGRLGDGTVTFRPQPVLVAASGYSAVTAGERHTCALRTDGTAACWGNNLTGQLGDGTLQQRRVPTNAAVGFTFAQISAGYWHTCGRTPDRDVFCWGANDSGQLGDSTTTNSSLPVEAGSGGFWNDVSAGGGHTCALQSVLVYCWGANGTGQLGDGGLNAVEPDPKLTLLLTPTPKSSLASGGLFTCVRAEGSGVHCWGANRFGEVGNGSTVPEFVPVRVIQ